MLQTRKRWYDKNQRLARQLDTLMHVHPRDEFRVLKGLLDLIGSEAPDILNRFVIPSDVDNWHRRWYDKDPVYWLAINGLRHGNRALLNRVAQYLEKAFSPHMRGRHRRLARTRVRLPKEKR